MKLQQRSVFILPLRQHSRQSQLHSLIHHHSDIYSPILALEEGHRIQAFSRYPTSFNNKQRQTMVQDWEREHEQAIVTEAPQSTATQEDPDAWRDPFYGIH